MSLRVLYDSVLQQWLSVSQSVSDKGTYRAVRQQIKRIQFGMRCVLLKVAIGPIFRPQLPKVALFGSGRVFIASTPNFGPS